MKNTRTRKWSPQLVEKIRDLVKQNGPKETSYQDLSAWTNLSVNALKGAHRRFGLGLWFPRNETRVKSEEILKAFRKWEGTITSFCVHHNISRSTLRQILLDMEAYIPDKYRKKPFKWTKSRVEEVRNWVLQFDNVSSHDVAREFGMTSKAVQRLHQLHDIGLLPVGKYRKSLGLVRATKGVNLIKEYASV